MILIILLCATATKTILQFLLKFISITIFSQFQFIHLFNNLMKSRSRLRHFYKQISNAKAAFWFACFKVEKIIIFFNIRLPNWQVQEHRLGTVEIAVTAFSTVPMLLF